jgi:hypothetical protein
MYNNLIIVLLNETMGIELVQLVTNIQKKSSKTRIVIGCFHIAKSIFPCIKKLNIRYNNNMAANSSEGKEIEGPVFSAKLKDKGIKKMVMP